MKLRAYLTQPSPERRQQLQKTLASLVDAFQSGDEEGARALADAWNEHAVRKLEALDLYKQTFAMPRETMVDEALGAVPAWHDGLTWDVALEAIRAATAAELSEKETGFVWEMLEANFPGADFINLVYWPNLWFGIEEMPEMTAGEVLAYAMARSGRHLPDAPAVELTRPVPPPPRGPIAL